MNELGSFKLIGLSYGYLLLTNFAGRIDSVLGILSQKLGHLNIFFVCI